MTASDGHVILSCSKQNDLADYGNKYSKIGNKQINILEAYEGGLLDKTSVQDLLESYNFPSNTTFLIDECSAKSLQNPFEVKIEPDLPAQNSKRCHFLRF